MSETHEFTLPTISNGDIRDVSSLLKLPNNAFHGNNGTDPRQEALKRMDSFDVAACPGSGKTTLLVAKLAILAKKWNSSTHGICVLSHTNAAREEIETHLGRTLEGQKLLNYPHYIGTIHGFVNEFLSLPFLRSKGYEIKVIDDDICQKKRWFLLENHWLREKIKPSKLTIKTSNFHVGDISWGKGGTLGNDTETYRKIVDACKQSADDGYFCHDEMFIWANELIKTNPATTDIIRGRFPLLLIDEAQDNSSKQTKILHRIFMESNTPVIRQRFGDANQAIYDSRSATDPEEDIFPTASSISLPNSHRFGQSIAALADPLGLLPCGLNGSGPKHCITNKLDIKNTVFLFNENRAESVLTAYGDLILDTFTDKEISSNWFRAHAVGSVHNPPQEESNNFPYHVQHYMAKYNSKLNGPSPRPKSFVQHILLGKLLTERDGETHHFVENIAEALLRLSSLNTDHSVIKTPKNKHRYILNLLQSPPCNNKLASLYLRFINKLTVEKYFPTKEEWLSQWQKPIKQFSREISERATNSKQLSNEAKKFLDWPDNVPSPYKKEDITESENNIFLHQNKHSKVSIKVGSIHSVKGQTHTATLVLETFWHDHNLAKLIPWISGVKQGFNNDGKRQKARLKNHYVAMTRPTHLLCLAMKKSSISESDIIEIQKQGWNIVEV